MRPTTMRGKHRRSTNMVNNLYNSAKERQRKDLERESVGRRRDGGGRWEDLVVRYLGRRWSGE